MIIRQGGSVLTILMVFMVAGSCRRSRNSGIPVSETSVVRGNDFVVYSPAHPSKQRLRDSSSVRFQVPAPQILSGVLKDPQGAVIGNLKMALGCTGLNKVAETDYYGKFNLGPVQAGECIITLDPGPWLAPTVKCSAESCMIEPQLTLKRGMNKVIEN